MIPAILIGAAVLFFYLDARFPASTDRGELFYPYADDIKSTR